MGDTKKGIKIWSDKYQGDLEAAKMISFQENVAAETAVRVAGDNAAVSKHLAGISRNKAAPELTTYEAMLRYWESNILHTPQAYIRAIRALEHAVGPRTQLWANLVNACRSIRR